MTAWSADIIYSWGVCINIASVKILRNSLKCYVNHQLKFAQHDINYISINSRSLGQNLDSRQGVPEQNYDSFMISNVSSASPSDANLILLSDRNSSSDRLHNVNNGKELIDVVVQDTIYTLVGKSLSNSPIQHWLLKWIHLFLTLTLHLRQWKMNHQCYHRQNIESTSSVHDTFTNPLWTCSVKASQAQLKWSK